MSKDKPPLVKRLAQTILGHRWYHMLAACCCQVRDDLDPRYRASLRRITALEDTHRGERCFIIGNGPSLSNMDLSPLRTETTFGLNRIYLLFEEMGFATNYHVAFNRLVIEQCAHEIVRLPCLKFVKWHARDTIDFAEDMVFLHSRDSRRFFTDIAAGVWEGATVTFVAMQIAYYLGFREVILIGVDHHFESKGEPRSTVVSSGDDPDHFDRRYFGKGFRWQLPDLVTSELAYNLAKYEFERVGREIVDATVNGKLQVFRKVDYRTLFA